MIFKILTCIKKSHNLIILSGSIDIGMAIVKIVEQLFLIYTLLIPNSAFLEGIVIICLTCCDLLKHELLIKRSSDRFGSRMQTSLIKYFRLEPSFVRYLLRFLASNPVVVLFVHTCTDPHSPCVHVCGGIILM